MNRTLATGAALAFLWASGALAQGRPAVDPARGKQLAGQICAACHGADGNSIAPANPKLAGQIPEYLYKQLANFKPQGGKEPERKNAVMTGMVATLTDEDMRSAAAHYASLALKPAVARDKDLALAGQKLYRGGNASIGMPACAGCHGPNGAGIPAQYPRIAGQYPEYIAAQLQAFRSGARSNDPNGMMRGVTARMSDQEIRALAEFVAGLR